MITQDENRPSAVGTAREMLRAAHGAMVEAQYALEMAQAASERARLFHAGAVERRDQFAEIDKTIAVERSREVKASLIRGEAPTFTNAPELSRNAVALLEAQGRVDAALVAMHDIEGIESEAAGAMARAQDEVRQAVEALVLAEADVFAGRIVELEAEALQLRVRMGGGQYAAIATMGLTLSQTLARTLQENDLMGDRFVHNGALWHASKRASEVWRDHVAALMTDPDSELTFDKQPEQAMAAE